MCAVTRAQQKSLAGLVLVAVLVALLWWTQTPAQTPAQAPAQTGDLTTVHVDRLPDEAHETIRLIQQDGPFPHDEDGSTFQNREGLLPDQPRGYYREYTVETPGEDDRGARRIVTGGDTMYWTADHYSSFARIVGVD